MKSNLRSLLEKQNDLDNDFFLSKLSHCYRSPSCNVQSELDSINLFCAIILHYICKDLSGPIMA